MPAPDKDKNPEKYKEFCKKRSEAWSGKNNPKYGGGHVVTAEERRKNSETTKGQWSDPNSIYNSETFRKKRRDAIVGKEKSKEHCEKISKAKKKQWANPSSTFNSEEYRKKQSVALSGKNNPMYEKREKDSPNYGSKRTKKTKRLMGISSSIARLKDWQKLEYQEKQKKSRGLKPNCLELEMGSILPDGFVYVGDFSMFLGSKNPDFINEKSRLIIEAFGDYYHQGGNKEAWRRINYFKKHGFKTLVIWESSFHKNPQKVKESIFAFSGGGLGSTVI